jgi:hypothetical protein
MFPQLLSKISTLVETWTRMMGKIHEGVKRGGQMVIKEALCCFCYLDGCFIQEIYHVSVCLYFQLPLLHLFKLRINIPSTASNHIHNVRHRNLSSSPRRHNRYSQVTRRINITRPLTPLPPNRSFDHNSNIPIVFYTPEHNRRRVG